MSLTVQKVTSKDELQQFASFANRLYKGNPYYVPAMVRDEMQVLDRGHNPAFEFCDADYFLALRDGRVVGRVAAIYNPRANEAWDKNAVRFGWLDFEDDPDVSAALMDAVRQWGKERGCEEMEGPLGFTDFDPEGMLVEGFDQIGTMATIYNYPYYKEHMERLGLTGRADWVEFLIDLPDELPDRYERYSRLVMQKYKLHARRFTRREIREKHIGRRLFHLINETYCDLFGYSPLSDAQIEMYVESYLPMLNLDYVSFIVDDADEIVAFGIAYPNMSRALQKAGGKYFPAGWWHLLKGFKGIGSDTVDLMLIAVRRDLRRKCVPALIVYDLYPRLKRDGIRHAESNPELETNWSVQNLWNSFPAVCHKRRRIYGCRF